MYYTLEELQESPDMRISYPARRLIEEQNYPKHACFEIRLVQVIK